MNRNLKQQHRNSVHYRTSGLLLGLALITQGACVPQSGPETGARVNQPPHAMDPASPVTGEVPAELLDKIISDLATKGNFNREAISTLRAESVIWPDGSLGCPKPGEMYTQAQVQGYWVVLQAAGKKFDYRASSTGYFLRCANTFKVQPPVG